MTHTQLIFAAILALFLVFITARGSLGTYIRLLV